MRGPIVNAVTEALRVSRANGVPHVTDYWRVHLRGTSWARALVDVTRESHVRDQILMMQRLGMTARSPQRLRALTAIDAEYIEGQTWNAN